MTTTHPTPTAATAPCPHCARLARRLDHVEAELAIACWTLKALCERLDLDGLAGLVAKLVAYEDEDAAGPD